MLSRRAGHLRHCPACEYQSFPRLDPAIIVLVHAGDAALLRTHLENFGTGDAGRVFSNERGGPFVEASARRAWARARLSALTEEQAHSPLARRPYDLRHAAASLWLNNGVPATEVAQRLGHDVAVLLKIYANCIDGQEGEINDRITAALAAGYDRETLPAAPVVDTAAQSNPRTRRSNA